MTRGRHGPSLDDDHLLETVEQLAARGETLDGDGGVTAARLAAELPFKRSTVVDHCSALVASGDLEPAWGFEGGRPTRGYLPADETAADSEETRRLITDGGVELREGETRDDENTHASVVDQQLAEADADLRAELEARHGDEGVDVVSDPLDTPEEAGNQ